MKVILAEAMGICFVVRDALGVMRGGWRCRRR